MMFNQSLITYSKFLSMILRHKPEKIGITLDKNGWTNVNVLLTNMSNYGYPITQDILETIVSNDNKQRYSFNDNHTLIRANQGHSVNVDVKPKESIPPIILYHGTKKSYLNNIKKRGLSKMKRLYVHLSSNIDTAIQVANRRKGESVILSIDTKSMIADHYKFYLSDNNVWLTDNVPFKYISILNKFINQERI